MCDPSCFLAAKDVFVTGVMLPIEVGDGDGRVELRGDTCGFHAPPPLSDAISSTRGGFHWTTFGSKDVRIYEVLIGFETVIDARLFLRDTRFDQKTRLLSRVQDSRPLYLKSCGFRASSASIREREKKFRRWSRDDDDDDDDYDDESGRRGGTPEE